MEKQQILLNQVWNYINNCYHIPGDIGTFNTIDITFRTFNRLLHHD